MAVSVATVETAITSILDSGQSVVVDGVTYNKGNLKSLWEMRSALKEEALRTGDTRPLIRAVNFGGMGYATTGDGATPTPVTPNAG